MNTDKLRFSWMLVVLIFLGFVSPVKDQTVKDFSLKNIDGKQVSLIDYKNAKGFIVVFTCNHCPFAKLYPQRLIQLSNKYEKLGVPLIAISSTDTNVYEEDSFEKMVIKSTQGKYTFPYLFDGNQTVAKNFKAEKTPNAFVIWKLQNEWVVKYSGAIDDNGAEPEKVQNHFVAEAVDLLLANKEVVLKETKSIGCQIYYRK